MIVKEKVKESEPFVKGPIDPDQVYTLLDGTLVNGAELIEMEYEMRFTSYPLEMYFCAKCNHQLRLIGGGWYCSACGSMNQEA